MKYKLSIRKQSGFEYSVVDGILKINDTLIEEPIDESIIEYDITEEEIALGITRCYREDGEVICHLTLSVEDLEKYKSGPGVRAGEAVSYNSKFDFSKLFTAADVLTGNYVPEVIEDV